MGNPWESIPNKHGSLPGFYKVWIEELASGAWPLHEIDLVAYKTVATGQLDKCTSTRAKGKLLLSFIDELCQFGEKLTAAIRNKELSGEYVLDYPELFNGYKDDLETLIMSFFDQLTSSDQMKYATRLWRNGNRKQQKPSRKESRTYQDEDELTAQEAADYIGVSIKTLYNYVNEGKLRPRHAGKPLIFLFSEVMRFNALRKGEAPREQEKSKPKKTASSTAKADTGMSAGDSVIDHLCKRLSPRYLDNVGLQYFAEVLRNGRIPDQPVHVIDWLGSMESLLSLVILCERIGWIRIEGRRKAMGRKDSPSGGREAAPFYESRIKRSFTIGGAQITTNDITRPVKRIWNDVKLLDDGDRSFYRRFIPKTKIGESLIDVLKSKSLVNALGASDKMKYDIERSKLLKSLSSLDGDIIDICQTAVIASSSEKKP